MSVASPFQRAPDLNADAIVVLGCRVLSSGGLTTPAEGRARAAAEAFRAGVACHILVSGGRRWGAHAEASAIQRWLVADGIAENAITAELLSMTTYENALFSAAILRARGARTAAVVTCDWHMPRALAAFQSLGIQVIAWPRKAPRRTFDRVAERIRRAVDARALRHPDALALPAASFFHPSKPSQTP
ncbi:MAG: YdcF family protein [Polyangiaceae bacterium]|nr:YdcF family protein [Polyangiaceae bacterium]